MLLIRKLHIYRDLLVTTSNFPNSSKVPVKWKKYNTTKEKLQ